MTITEIVGLAILIVVFGAPGMIELYLIGKRS